VWLAHAPSPTRTGLRAYRSQCRILDPPGDDSHSTPSPRVISLAPCFFRHALKAGLRAHTPTPGSVFLKHALRACFRIRFGVPPSGGFGAGLGLLLVGVA